MACSSSTACACSHAAFTVLAAPDPLCCMRSSIFSSRMAPTLRQPSAARLAGKLPIAVANRLQVAPSFSCALNSRLACGQQRGINTAEMSQGFPESRGTNFILHAMDLHMTSHIHLQQELHSLMLKRRRHDVCSLDTTLSMQTYNSYQSLQLAIQWPYRSSPVMRFK